MSSLPPEVVDKLEQIGSDLDSISETTLSDSEATTVFTEQVSHTLTFFGKTLAVWEDSLVVPITDVDDLDHKELRRLYGQLANNLQLASHYYALSNAAHSVSIDAVDIKRADLITALVSHYHGQGMKVPPAIVLEKLADGYIKRLSNVSNISKIVRTFWKDKIAILERTDSILSKIAISLATEAKHGNVTDTE